jgi:hypothetical protein
MCARQLAQHFLRLVRERDGRQPDDWVADVHTTGPFVFRTTTCHSLQASVRPEPLRSARRPSTGQESRRRTHPRLIIVAVWIRRFGEGDQRWSSLPIVMIERSARPGWVLVFDNMKTVTIGRDDQEQPIWHRSLLQLAAEFDFHPVACWPESGNQKGSVESLVKFTKTNFLVGRTFVDDGDLEVKCDQWQARVNTERRSQATDVDALSWRGSRSWSSTTFGHSSIWSSSSSKVDRSPRCWISNTSKRNSRQTTSTCACTPPPGSDRSTGFQIEALHLTPLPEQRFVGTLALSRKVSWDCVVSFRGSRFSVPAVYAGKRV